MSDKCITFWFFCGLFGFIWLSHMQWLPLHLVTHTHMHTHTCTLTPTSSVPMLLRVKRHFDGAPDTLVHRTHLREDYLFILREWGPRDRYRDWVKSSVWDTVSFFPGLIDFSPQCINDSLVQRAIHSLHIPTHQLKKSCKSLIYEVLRLGLA